MAPTLHFLPLLLACASVGDGAFAMPGPHNDARPDLPAPPDLRRGSLSRDASTAPPPQRLQRRASDERKPNYGHQYTGQGHNYYPPITQFHRPAPERGLTDEVLNMRARLGLPMGRGAVRQVYADSSRFVKYNLLHGKMGGLSLGRDPGGARTVVRTAPNPALKHAALAHMATHPIVTDSGLAREQREKFESAPGLPVGAPVALPWKQAWHAQQPPEKIALPWKQEWHAQQQQQQQQQRAAPPGSLRAHFEAGTVPMPPDPAPMQMPREPGRHRGRPIPKPYDNDPDSPK